MELNYKQFGSGEPLIILHGLFGMLDNWQTLAKKLSTKFEVFIIDQRNHGRSPHSDEHNYQILARDVYDFLEEQNIYSTNILGHSMGGKVAMQFAAFFPGFVKKLIIADIAPKSYTESRLDHERIFEAIGLLGNCRFNNRRLAEEKLREIISDDRIYYFILKNLKIDDKGCTVWKFNSSVLKKNYPQLTGNIIITVPVKSNTLFLKAANSDYILINDYENIKLLFPNSEIVTIPDSGHWLHVDQSEIFYQNVIDFLIPIN